MTAVTEGTMAEPQYQIYAVRVFVRDWVRALAFYRNTLGMHASFVSEEHGWAELDVGGARLGLERVAPGDAEGEALLGRFLGVSLRVDDVRQVYETLRERGVAFPGPPERQPWGGVLAHLSDPEGNVLTLLGEAKE